MIRGKNKIGIIEEIQIVPDNTNVKNYAFDVTPSKFVTGIITERGVCAASKDQLQIYFLKRCKMKNLWSDKEAKNFVNYYSKSGINEDLSLRVYTSSF